MKDLIEALQIFYKYTGDINNPTLCEHNVMIVAYDETVCLNIKDAHRVKELGFFYSTDDECWKSYRFGSA